MVDVVASSRSWQPTYLCLRIAGYLAVPDARLQAERVVNPFSQDSHVLRLVPVYPGGESPFRHTDPIQYTPGRVREEVTCNDRL